MRGMVLDPMDARSGGARRKCEGDPQRVRNLPDLLMIGGAVPDQVSIGTMAQSEERLPPQVGFRVARDRHVVDLLAGDAAHLQAGADRGVRKAGDVLDALEAF